MNYASIKLTAQIAYEAYRTYCRSLGDYSQLPWSALHQLNKNKEIAMVEFLLSREHMPEYYHNKWVQKMIKDGWVYGEEMSEINKTDPYLKPYYELPRNDKTKDYLFKSIVDSLRKY